MSNVTRPLAAVTGASSGIGFELAKQLARHGHDLLLVSRGDGLDAAERELRTLGVKVWSHAADLRTAVGVEETYRFLRRQGRPLDVVVLNAGVGLGGAFVGQTRLEDEMALIQLNVMSTVHLAKLVLPEMVAAGRGRVLFTSSISATAPIPFEAVYGASKAFINSFAFALRNELKDSGVTLTVLMPGQTDTHFFHRAGEDDTRVGAGPKNDPAQVAAQGYAALMQGLDLVYGGGPEVQHEGEVLNRVESEAQQAERHRTWSEPGSAPREE